MFQNFFSCYTNVPRTLHYVSQKFQEPKKIRMNDERNTRMENRASVSASFHVSAHEGSRPRARWGVTRWSCDMSVHLRARQEQICPDMPTWESSWNLFFARYYKWIFRRRVSRSNGQEIFYKYVRNILKCLGTFKNVMELFKMIRKFQSSSRTFSKGPMEQV